MTELLRKLLFLPEQASNFAAGTDALHYFVIITTFVAFVALALTTLVFVWRFRRRSDQDLTPKVNPPLGLEIAFVVVPLALFLLWFGMGYRHYVRMWNPPPNTMDVYVTGKQWMWQFNYAEGPNSIAILRVPEGRPVRLLLTSRDVIHSFFVPAFRLKADVLPGRYTQMWFTATKVGTYPIECSQYCGLSHSTMIGQVIVMSGPDFDAWLEDQKRGAYASRASAQGPSGVTPAADLVSQGREVAMKQGCLKCHTLDGSPHIGPTWLDLFGRTETLTTGEKVVADEAYLTLSMMDPNAQIVAGFQPVMPSFRGQISPAETAALVEYIKSLRSGSVEPQSSQRPESEPVPGR